MTVHWTQREQLKEDYELEMWLDEVLPWRIGSPDSRCYAETQEEWDAYVTKIKAYARSCVDHPENFDNWEDVIEPLKPHDGRLAL